MSLEPFYALCRNVEDRDCVLDLHIYKIYKLFLVYSFKKCPNVYSYQERLCSSCPVWCYINYKSTSI